MTMVIAQHCGLLPFGWIGVWLFYLISGYVITLGFARTQNQAINNKLPYFIAFVKRRVLRIVPAYVFYVSCVMLFFYVTTGFEGGHPIPYLATFTYNWYMMFVSLIEHFNWQPLAHLWTLSVEQQFYIVYPVLFLLMPEKYRWKTFLTIVLSGPLIRFLWLQLYVLPAQLQDSVSAFSVYASSFCHFDAFLLGACIVKIQESNSHEKEKIQFWIKWLSFIVIGTYTIILMHRNYLDGLSGIFLFKNIFSGLLFGSGREIWVYSCVNLISLNLILWVLTTKNLPSLFKNSFVLWVGRVSYGGYLYHGLIIWAGWVLFGLKFSALPIAQRIFCFCLVWLLTVMIASASFKHLEEPISRRFKSWAKQTN